MDRRRIPAPLIARLVRGASITVVLAMAAGVAPFAPTAPETAGLFGSMMLKALLATLALMALLGDVTARPLALAVAAAGSCHILQAGGWFTMHGGAHPFDWMIPLSGALTCLAAIVGLGIGAPRLEERRAEEAMPRNASRQRRLLGRSPAITGHHGPAAVRPVRVASATAQATPRPKRIKPVSARPVQATEASPLPASLHPTIRPGRTPPKAAKPATRQALLVLTPALRVASEPAAPFRDAAFPKTATAS